MGLRITTPQTQENGILAPMLHGGEFGCGGWFWVGAMANAADFEGHPALGPSGSLPKHASWPKLAKIHQNARGGWKRLSPRPKCKRFAGTSKQLQKPHKLAPGHALARFWPPGPMQQARGLAWWVPPGLTHFFGRGGISRKFPPLGGQHATLPICLPPKLGAH